MIQFRIATMKDAVDLSSRLRAEDKAELLAATGKPLEQALISSYTGSELCLVATLDDEPIMMCGVSRFNVDIGFPWLVGTNELEANTLEVLLVGRTIIELFNKMFNVLTCCIGRSNTLQAQMLRSLGFSLIKEHTLAARPLNQFIRYNPNV